VGSEHTHSVSPIRVVAEDHTSFASRHVFDGMEAEDRSFAVRPYQAAFIAGPHRMCGLFHQAEAMAATEIPDGVKITRGSGKMYGHDAFCPSGYALFDVIWIDL